MRTILASLVMVGICSLVGCSGGESTTSTSKATIITPTNPQPSVSTVPTTPGAAPTK